MSLESKLRHHLAVAAPHATWSADAATWTDGAGQPRLLLWTEGALSAPLVVDAHVRALRARARPTLAHEGPATEVARAAAARFGVALLDASTLPEPLPEADVPVGGPADEGGAVPIVPEVEIPPALVAQMVEGLLPAPVDVGVAAASAANAAGAEAPQPPSLPPALAPDVDPRLPWPVGPTPEPPLALAVPAEELAAMPWNAPHVLLQATPSPDEAHHELVLTERRPLGALRPTQLPDWGLPWPRPVAPTDGLALHDPKLWGNRERVQAVRDGIDRATGGASFGAVKPDGSAWLKRLQGGLR